MSRARADRLGLPVAVSGPIAYTPTVTWAGNTITTQSGFYLKEPGKLTVWVSFSETAGTAAATLTITIPTGYTAVTHTASLSQYVGSVTATVSSFNYPMWAAAGATASIATPFVGTGAVATWGGVFVIPTLT